MIRFTKALAVAATLLVVPSLASALSLSIIGVSGGGADHVLNPGESVTFDLSVENDSGQFVNGVAVEIDGYDTVADQTGAYDNGIAFGSASAPPPSLFTIVQGVPDTGVRLALGPEERWEVNQLNPLAYTTSLFQGAGVAGFNGDGSQDQLLPNGAHFQVTFVNVAPTNTDTYVALQTTLNFNLIAIGAGGAVLPTTGDSFNLTAIPEPGTALLMGLGLAGLAGARRR